MPIEVKAYKCNWCPRVMGRKVNAIQHEDNCTCNPASRHCKTCVYSYKKVTEHIHKEKCDPFISQDIDYEITEPYCAYHDKPIHEEPYFIECDCAGGEYGDSYDVKFSCFYYKYKDFAGYQKEVPCVVEEVI